MTEAGIMPSLVLHSDLGYEQSLYFLWAVHHEIKKDHAGNIQHGDWRLLKV